MENGVYLLLGSNLGKRDQNLLQARDFIAKIGRIKKASSIYQTQAWGNAEQPDFLNQVIEIRYEHSAQVLLKEIQVIENKMGRVRREKWGPRIVDIDILFFGETIVHESDLVIPHPGIASRKFTLLPLTEIAGEYIHPVIRKTCKQLLEECTDSSRVARFEIQSQ